MHNYLSGICDWIESNSCSTKPFFVSIEYNSRERGNLRALPLICILFFKFMMRPDPSSLMLEINSHVWIWIGLIEKESEKRIFLSKLQKGPKSIPHTLWVKYMLLFIVLRPGPVVGPVQSPGSGFWLGHRVLTGLAGRPVQIFFFEKIKTTSF